MNVTSGLIDLAYSGVAAVASYGIFHATGSLLYAVLMLVGFLVVFVLWRRSPPEDDSIGSEVGPDSNQGDRGRPSGG